LLSTSGNTASFRAGTAAGSAWVRILVNGVQAAHHNFSIAETPAGFISGPYSGAPCYCLVGVVEPGNYQFYATNVPSSVTGSNVRWEVLMPDYPIFLALYEGKSPMIGFVTNGIYTLKMKWYGTCGYSPYATMNITVTGGTDDPRVLLSAYPNPASSVLNIEIEEDLQPMLQSSSSSAISSPASVYRVRLVSVQTGAVEYNQVLSSNNLSVNVSAIPDGLYSLTLTQGSTLLHSKIILIRH
jgi:hypothetical protein